MKVFRNIPLCFIPLLTFVFVKEEWLARLIAVSGFYCIINLIVFFYGFNPKSNFISPKSRVALYGTQQEKQFKNNIAKGIFVSFGLVLFFYLNLSLIEDCIGSIQHGRSYLEEVKGRVVSNNMTFGAYAFNQNINIVDTNNQLRSFSATFYPRIFKDNMTYVFLITPKSNRILDAMQGAKWRSDNLD
jgi:hypothetical protein